MFDTLQLQKLFLVAQHVAKQAASVYVNAVFYTIFLSVVYVCVQINLVVCGQYCRDTSV